MRCIDCGKDLRSCKHCRHYRGGDCVESAPGSGADKPADPERANFCDWFSLNPRFKEATEGEKKSLNAAASAKNAFNDLFN